jgi:predicted ATPase
MLRRFWVNNFRNLVDAEFRPAGINLLVGANNAGKTNLCQALRFISLTVRQSIEDAARECVAEPWNLVNVYSENRSFQIELDCDLSVDDELRHYQYQLCVNEHRYVNVPAARTLAAGQERLIVEDSTGTSVLLDAHNGSHTALHETVDVGGLVTPFKRYLLSWAYYYLEPAQLRTNVARPLDHRLDAFGTNLSSVLYTLHNERPRDENLLVKAAQILEPRLDLFSYQSPDPDHVYLFYEDARGNRFGVQSLSDGTVRFLAIGYIILSNRPSNGPWAGTPLIMIEEPENGIFVGYLKTLFEKIDPTGQQGQYIFTTHSPYFIDLFDGNLDGVHVVKSDEYGTRIVKPDSERLQNLLDKFSLGEMHFRGLLQ